MAFKMSVQKYSGKISEVEIGTGEKAIKIGGENILPGAIIYDLCHMKSSANY